MTSRLRLAFLLLLLVLVFSLGLLLGRRQKLITERAPTIPTLQSGSQLPVETNILPKEDGSVSHKVIRVIDGDTIVLDSGEHVRYLGLNAPELSQPWGQAAKEENEKLVLGQTVKLEFDAVKKDKYGRTLAYVWVNDVLANEKVLAEGLAKILIFDREPPLKYENRLRLAEASAQKKTLGLWQKYGN